MPVLRVVKLAVNPESVALCSSKLVITALVDGADQETVILADVPAVEAAVTVGAPMYNEDTDESA
jgi:hypothetical protein